MIMVNLAVPRGRLDRSTGGQLRPPAHLDHEQGGGSLTVTVVPDSGIGELAGIRGEMVIHVVSGEQPYTFGYTLDGVGAELVIHGGDLRYRWAVVIRHDRPLWHYDCCI
jgi:hypothetical protein